MIIEIFKTNFVWLFVITSYLITFFSLFVLYFRSAQKLSAITHLEISKDREIKRFSSASSQEI